jgi:hypothetical protein
VPTAGIDKGKFYFRKIIFPQSVRTGYFRQKRKVELTGKSETEDEIVSCLVNISYRLIVRNFNGLKIPVLIWFSGVMKAVSSFQMGILAETDLVKTRLKMIGIKKVIKRVFIIPD